ncbi:hypothetical protein sos41_32420 [Alphaproteobacteria bacterium SO-S41]|nr:hypothetical protein sos41_32420 [Alphaproteobacteria bacterium SO-S41]
MPRHRSIAAFVLSAAAALSTAHAGSFAILFDGKTSQYEAKGQDNPSVAIEGCEIFRVIIRTGDLANGGTDGNVYLTINGEHGTTGAIDLGNTDWQNPDGASTTPGCDATALVMPDTSNPSNSFEAGSTETFLIFAPAVGMVPTGGTLLMTASGTAASGWFVQSVRIHGSQQIGDKWTMIPLPLTAFVTAWLESSVPRSLSEGTNQPTAYTLTLKTGTGSGAGTDSDITVRVAGIDSDGQSVSFEQTVNPYISGNAFENGSSDSAVIPDQPAIAHLTGVTVTTADNYAGSAWQLDSLEVSAPSLCGGAPGANCAYNKPEQFAIGQWLDGDHRSISLTAGSIDEPYDRPGAGESEPHFCVRMGRAIQLPASATETVCRNTQNARKDMACLVFATWWEQPADLWAEKCAAGADAALEELSALVGGTSGTTASAEPAPNRGTPEPGMPPGEPAAGPGPAPAASGGAEEQRCMSMVDGQIAWSQSGETSWNPDNIAALCAGATDADARIACFTNRIAAGEDWSTAIPACAANDRAPIEASPLPEDPAPVPGEPASGPESTSPNSGSEAEVQRCKELLQDQVPWQIDPPERHWSEPALNALCNGTTDAAATVMCFQDALYNNGQETTIQIAIDACRKD